MFCEQIDKQTKIFLWQWHLMELEFANCLIMYSYRCCDKFFLYIFVFILLKNPISLLIFIVYSISFIILRIWYKKCPSKVESNANDLPSFDGFILIVFLCTYCLPDILFILLIPFTCKACWLSHNVIERIIDLISVYWEAWFWQQFLIHIVEF